jgi:hypothetical protein
MFKENIEGKTNYCEACEQEARGRIKTSIPHTCGLFGLNEEDTKEVALKAAKLANEEQKALFDRNKPFIDKPLDPFDDSNDGGDEEPDFERLNTNKPFVDKKIASEIGQILADFEQDKDDAKAVNNIFDIIFETLTDQAKEAYDDGYKQGVKDELECIETNPEHSNILKKIHNNGFEKGISETMDLYEVIGIKSNYENYNIKNSSNLYKDR